jgi:gas vesicle protein
MDITNIANLKNSEIDNLKRDELRQVLKTAVPVVKQNLHQTDLTQIMQLIQTSQEQNGNNFQKINDQLGKLAEKLTKDIREEFDPQIRELQEENKDLRTVVSKQQAFIEQLDINQRANNIIISGLPEDDSLNSDDQTAYTDEDKCEMVLSAIDSTAEIQEIFRLGKRNPTTVRPVKVTLCRSSDRVDIISKASLLSTKNHQLKKYPNQERFTSTSAKRMGQAP